MMSAPLGLSQWAFWAVRLRVISLSRLPSMLRSECLFWNRTKAIWGHCLMVQGSGAEADHWMMLYCRPCFNLCCRGSKLMASDCTWSAQWSKPSLSWLWEDSPDSKAKPLLVLSSPQYFFLCLSNKGWVKASAHVMRFYSAMISHWLIMPHSAMPNHMTLPSAMSCQGKVAVLSEMKGECSNKPDQKNTHLAEAICLLLQCNSLSLEVFSITGLIKISFEAKNKWLALWIQIDGPSNLSAGDKTNCFMGHYKGHL